jgi:Ca2+-binding EF-hand superfamily protein
LGATDLRKVITHQNISQTFKYIDTDNSEKISMAELQARLGDHLDATQY